MAAAEEAQGNEEVWAFVRDIWCEVLSITPDRFHAEMGFIAAGGFSLAAIRLLDGVRQRFKVDLDLAQVLGDMSAESLCAHVANALISSRSARVQDADGVWEDGFI
jgi:acyl carrier protein